MLRTPVIVLNVKTYDQAIGEKVIEIARIMEDIGNKKDVSMAIAVQATDISRVKDAVSIPVWAEHIDPIKPGSHTGWTLAEAVKEAGAVGTLINHSEHRLTLADIDACLTRAKETMLESIVCTNNIQTSKAAAALNPHFVAVEPPELIGGDISVTSADPDIVSGSVDAVKSVNSSVKVLCGAGVKDGKDVSKALDLGSAGVLLASGVVKAKDKREVIEDLASGIA
ncbi:MAG: triose-phosphate isomerase [Candidatus Thermoplasmatota archaeon]|nr:triose-phosphate isomerase [Candidatus Thermoplasmatota archaeon]